MGQKRLSGLCEHRQDIWLGKQKENRYGTIYYSGCLLLDVRLQLFICRSLLAVFRIRDVSGSAALVYGSGSCSFLQWLSICQPKNKFSSLIILLITYRYPYVHLLQSSKITSYKEVKKNFCLLMQERSVSRAGSGSVQIITGRARISAFWTFFLVLGIESYLR